MSSRFSNLTLADERSNFQKNLKNAVELGAFPNSGDHLPSTVFDTITEIAKKYPESDGALVKKAKEQFRRYVAWLTED